MTLLDFCEIVLSCSGERLPAPGRSRSITNLGISRSPFLLTYSWYGAFRTVGTEVKTLIGKDKREAQGDATRLALVTAARGLFGERGYAATSIEEVAARAGVTKGAVYHHFGGKANLFQEVYEEVMR